MKTIGLLGGMSPESTVDYYQQINAGVNQALGGHHGARMIAYSVDLEIVFQQLERREYGALASQLGDAARSLEEGGADFVIIACNTAHVVAPQIADRLKIPLVHIADVLGEELTRAGVARVGLTGSQFTTGLPFYQDRLKSRFGIEVLVSDAAGRAEADRIIRDELCFRRVLDSSRETLTDQARGLRYRGAQAIALACTELGLLFTDDEVAGLPAFDTTALHAGRAVDLALEKIQHTELTGAAA